MKLMAKPTNYNQRRLIFGGLVLTVMAGLLVWGGTSLGNLADLAQDWQEFVSYDLNMGHFTPDAKSLTKLDSLEVKGRAPKTGYKRDLFGGGWGTANGCTTRNLILLRDLQQVVNNSSCKVQSGILADPYTGEQIIFQYGAETSQAVQIDHVVAVSDAWQKGAQNWEQAKRVRFYNDPLNLLAVDGAANQAKSDSDAASWLPPNKAFRCEYVSRQVEVKAKYGLWITEAEKQAISRELNKCLN